MERFVQFEIIVKGDNKNFPQKGNTVSVHYTGYIEEKDSNGKPNGKWKKFDSSRDRKRPFKFTLGVGEVIKGWELAVSQMSVGERAKVTMAPKVAYGSSGFKGLIPGGEEIVFDIELLGFN